ncbi:MAG: hypothetical protein J6U23_09680 [Clostridiales bacterium]|nr:hypothetical protein [Clostridiales bacterium]
MEMHITKENVETLLYWMENKVEEELKMSNYYLLQEEFLHADKYWPMKDKTTKEAIIEKHREKRKNLSKSKKHVEEKRLFDENMEDLEKYSEMTNEDIAELDEYELSLYEDSYLAVLDFANSVIRLRKQAELKYQSSLELLIRERDNLEPNDEVWEKIINEVRESNEQEKFDFGEEFEALYKELFVLRKKELDDADEDED